MSTDKRLYHSVPSTDNFVDEDHVESSSTSRVRRLRWPLTQAILLLIIITQAVAILLLLRAQKYACHSIHGMPLHRTEPRTIYQHSKYVSLNESEASEAWDAILPGHGVVAIEPAYALSKGLPDTVVLPDSGGKKAYVIEAYHAMHCIVNLRQHYIAIQRNETWDWSNSHDLHCFDALRQYVMCNIDDTLLKTWGKRDAGHNQKKMCHDWDRLRDWAEERSGNYFDIDPGRGIRHLGNYHAGDGLPVGSLGWPLTNGIEPEHP